MSENFSIDNKKKEYYKKVIDFLDRLKPGVSKPPSAGEILKLFKKYALEDGYDFAGAMLVCYVEFWAGMMYEYIEQNLLVPGNPCEILNLDKNDCNVVKKIKESTIYSNNYSKMNEKFDAVKTLVSEDGKNIFSSLLSLNKETSKQKNDFKDLVSLTNKCIKLYIGNNENVGKVFNRFSYIINECD